MRIPTFRSLTSKLVLIAIVSALAWSSSITNEFVGYDDIKLIVRNDKVQQDLGYTLRFYWNIVSDSHNIAWTNYPTVIYRPLEWFGSAVGYHIWGPRSWAYHLFVNFSFHIINSILLFFILSKIFGTPLSGEQTEYAVVEKDIQAASQPKTKSKSKKKFPSVTKAVNQSLTLSWWVPFVIVLIWTVHPLHNEAVNMLTSGVGFLWSTLFCFTAVVINLYVKDLMGLKGLLLIILSWIFMFIGYHGSEMTVIVTATLVLIFFNSIVKRDYKSYGFEIPKILFAATSFLTYYAHRASIVSEQGEWASRNPSEFFERLLVVAPEIFFHYIRLFFFPAKLSMDEHHNVILGNAFTPFHLMCFIIAGAFVFGIIYYLLIDKEEKYLLHNRIIGGSMLFAGLSISISLNIIPLYCLARDRYTYFFLIGLIAAIIVAIDKEIFKRRQVTNYRPWLIALVVIVLAFGTRAWFKSWDWHDGERFWSQAMDSVDDLGTKQNWRYRLIQYYIDPGTDTFKPNPIIKERALNDFNRFAIDNNLNQTAVIQKYLNEEKDPNLYLLNKYGYRGNKTIASALFFNATTSIENRDGENALNYFKLSHIYYPDHFQTNLQVLIHTWGQDPKLSDYLLKKMEKDAINNSFLAKGLMDGLFFIKHPQVYEYAKLFKSRFPNTQVFQVYLFHGALMAGDYDNAYQYAKVALLKYHEDEVFEQYIQQYEAGRFRKQ